MSKQFYFKQFSLAYICSLYVKTVLLQIIQFSISMQFSSILPTDRTLSGAATLGQSGPGRDANDGVLHIPQSSSITGTSPSDCLVSNTGHSLKGVLPLCIDAVGIFYSSSWQGTKFIIVHFYHHQQCRWFNRIHMTQENLYSFLMSLNVSCPYLNKFEGLNIVV